MSLEDTVRQVSKKTHINEQPEPQPPVQTLQRPIISGRNRFRRKKLRRSSLPQAAAAGGVAIGMIVMLRWAGALIDIGLFTLAATARLTPAVRRSLSENNSGRNRWLYPAWLVTTIFLGLSFAHSGVAHAITGSAASGRARVELLRTLPAVCFFGVWWLRIRRTRRKCCAIYGPGITKLSNMRTHTLGDKCSSDNDYHNHS